MLKQICGRHVQLANPYSGHVRHRLPPGDLTRAVIAVQAVQAVETGGIAAGTALRVVDRLRHPAAVAAVGITLPARTIVVNVITTEETAIVREPQTNAIEESRKTATCQRQLMAMTSVKMA